jgi:hypothetical protein
VITAHGRSPNLLFGVAKYLPGGPKTVLRFRMRQHTMELIAAFSLDILEK